MEESQKKWQFKDGIRYQQLLNKVKNLELEKRNISFDGSNLDIESKPQDNSIIKEIEEYAKELISWRKGPIQLSSFLIDTEWRSDEKWKRLASHLPDLKNKTILDVGCNNGFYMFLMALSEPRLVLGVDPVILYKTQFEFLNLFAQKQNLFHSMIGAEEIKFFKDCFDVIFHMGVLYHHRDPLQQLMHIRDSLTKKGTMVLETICLPGDDIKSITPAGSYAGMRNIWLLPTVPQLKIWLERLKFKNINLVSTEWGHQEEQRVTDWSGKKSYEDHLDPQNESKTIEGLDRPNRAIFICET